MNAMVCAYDEIVRKRDAQVAELQEQLASPAIAR